MLKTVTAIQFHKPMGVGKTAPSLLTCVDDEGNQIELVVKFAAGCEGGTGSLVREVLGALMAADLDLPVPEPFLVNVEADFTATIPELDDRCRVTKHHAARSLGLNFGSKKLPPGFSTIMKGRPVSQTLMPTAAEILAFDIFIANPDRTVANPNCQSNGREFAIFDHELAFRTEGILFWKAPWESGGVSFPKGQPDNIRHVFLDEVRGGAPDFSRLAGAFDVISDERLNEYRNALPGEWDGKGHDVGSILEYIQTLKANIEAAICNLEDVLQ